MGPLLRAARPFVPKILFSGTGILRGLFFPVLKMGLLLLGIGMNLDVLEICGGEPGD